MTQILRSKNKKKNMIAEGDPKALVGRKGEPAKKCKKKKKIRWLFDCFAKTRKIPTPPRRVMLKQPRRKLSSGREPVDISTLGKIEEPEGEQNTYSASRYQKQENNTLTRKHIHFGL